MRKIPWIAILLLFLATPPVLSAQGFAVGARAGTMGLGGEVALGLSDVITLRGGFGVFPYEYDGDYDGEEYTVSFPSSVWSAGVDLYLGGGPFRLMGGVMGRTGDLEVGATFTGSREIGGNTYTSGGTLTGVLEQSSIAPFAGIGFGKHTAGGFGFFLDVGAAFAGEADVVMSVSGPVASVPGIQSDVQQEADKISDDLGTYLKIWPIVSLGIKIPISSGY